MKDPITEYAEIFQLFANNFLTIKPLFQSVDLLS